MMRIPLNMANHKSKRFSTRDLWLIIIISFFSLYWNKGYAKELNLHLTGKAVKTSVLLPTNTSTIIKYAVDDIQKDCKEATGSAFIVESQLPANATTVIIPFEVSNIPMEVATLEKEGKVDFSSLQGKWESYVIKPLKDPFNKGYNVLLVAGSDGRGAMYGLYDISEKVFGTDPQKLWTDAKPKKVSNAVWNFGTVTKGEPTFKYRGWFVNDENYLLSWKGPNKDDMRIEPEVWADIFETMCRMRANFYTIIEYGWSPDSTTLKLANDRGLSVMGSHMHMLIANTSHEWGPFVQNKYGKDLPYDWSTNRDEMISFWEESVKKYKDYLAIWPVGLKSWNDRDFCETDPGSPRTPEGRTIFTNDAIREQTKLLDKYLDPSKGKPICSYVMRGDPVLQYHTGKLKFPENTVILWPDNPSFGMMGEVPTKEDFARNPLHGIFFHLTYCDNQWVQWTPLKQVQHELLKAVNANATTMAEFNVGDIRELPLKISMAMDVTNNAKPWKANPDYWRTFTESWCKKQYSSSNVKKIVDLYEKYWGMEMPCRSTIVVESISWYTVMPGNILDSIKGKSDIGKAIGDYIANRVRIPSGDRFGKMGLPYLKETSLSWDVLYNQVKEATSLVNSSRRQFYFDSFTLQVQTSRLVNHWGADVLSAFEAIGKKDFKTAATHLESATKWLKEMKIERDKAQHDKWENWFRGEENISWINSFWGFHIDREIDTDLKLAAILKSL
ncbi:MAG: glycosyl hydrolase 115 family protein [Bacteroidota bacterium]|nr:glycosyl hydrolase 115 family protein [Bacteroidota bacterium]